jgi:hypothetical protein
MARTAEKDEPAKDKKKARPALSHDLLNGLTPEEFNQEAKALAGMEAMTPAMRARLKAQLVERLKTPVDEPSWGPDWVRHGEKVAARNQRNKSLLAHWRDQRKKDNEEDDSDTDAKPSPVLSDRDADDASIIARNMEKARQVAHYKPLYVAAGLLALIIVLCSMFVDYHIIREIWTRALANEFMIVPPALQSSVVFKSLQVVFAVLIVHFMLKITGVYGRNTMVAASFFLALVMISGLGYLVAYNNMEGGTATAHEQHQTAPRDSIQQLFAQDGGLQNASVATSPVAAPSMVTNTADGVSLGLPKLSETSLAQADSWFWFAFASVVFFIVTTVAALYMQTVENNIRNFHIAQDYKHRKKDFALLHLLELADRGA